MLISEITLYDTLKITPLCISCFSGQWRGNCLEYFQHFVKWYGGKPQNIQGGNVYLYILNVHVSLPYTIWFFLFLLHLQILFNDVPIIWIKISEMFDLQWPKQLRITVFIDRLFLILILWCYYFSKYYHLVTITWAYLSKIFISECCLRYKLFYPRIYGLTRHNIF